MEMSYCISPLITQQNSCKIGWLYPTLCRLNYTCREYATYNMQKRAKKLCILSDPCCLIHGRTVESDLNLELHLAEHVGSSSQQPLPGVRFLPQFCLNKDSFCSYLWHWHSTFFFRNIMQKFQGHDLCESCKFKPIGDLYQ